MLSLLVDEDFSRLELADTRVTPEGLKKALPHLGRLQHLSLIRCDFPTVHEEPGDLDVTILQSNSTTQALTRIPYLQRECTRTERPRRLGTLVSRAHQPQTGRR